MGDESYHLPHGAIGIDSDEFAIEFKSNKIVVVRKSDDGGSHFTIQTDHPSGVIDLHETLLGDEGRKIYHTLFAMQRDDLRLVFEECRAILYDFLGLLRPLRLGWLNHRGIGIARGIDPVSDDNVASVTQRNRRRRLTLDKERWEANVFVPQYLEDVFDFPDVNFSLLYRGRKIGIGLKQTQPDGRIRLYSLKLRDLRKLANHWQPRVLDALSRAAMPRAKYGQYPFLQP